MFRIIGLWNGPDYQDTPHNIGGQILSSILKKQEFDFLKNSSNLFYNKNRQAYISQSFLKTKNKEEFLEIILPDTLMNLSGNVLKNELSNKEKTSLAEIKKIIIIYDDIDLPFGEIKISFNRGDGGHNGIKDIIKKIKSKKFIRIRIGVCPLDFFGNPRKPKSQNISNYLVNKKLSKKYLLKYQEIEKRVGQIIDFILKNNYQKAMNKFN